MSVMAKLKWWWTHSIVSVHRFLMLKDTIWSLALGQSPHWTYGLGCVKHSNFLKTFFQFVMALKKVAGLMPRRQDCLTFGKLACNSHAMWFCSCWIVSIDMHNTKMPISAAESVESLALCSNCQHLVPKWYFPVLWCIVVSRSCWWASLLLPATCTFPRTLRVEKPGGPQGCQASSTQHWIC